jgi:hypothetical protein
MLGCKSVQCRMSDALDGEIRGPYGWYVRFHSHVCYRCRPIRSSLERTVSLLGQLREPQKPLRDKSNTKLR